MKEFLRTLPVSLSASEVADRSKELADEIHEMALAKEEADGTKRRIADDLKLREARVKKLGDAVRTRAEPREVDCHEEVDLDRKLARVIRNDTGATVETRALSDLEIREARQATLPHIGPERSVTFTRETVARIREAAEELGATGMTVTVVGKGKRARKTTP